MNLVSATAHRLTRRPVFRLLCMAGLGLVALGWLTLAPTALGGSRTYVTTYGTSMEPTLHRGDLAIVRPQPTYRVGDIVAYRSRTLNRLVLHRIIGRDGERFLVKGDNNSWTDLDRPTAADLVGTMERRVPGLGKAVQRAGSPPAVASMVMVAFFPLAKSDRRRRRNAAAADTTRPMRSPRPPALWGHVEPHVLAMTAIGVAALAFTFTQPTSIRTTSDLPFDDRGTFTYTGSAPAGQAAYRTTQVSTGQPIFLNLVDQLDIGFTYDAASDARLEVAGEIALTGKVMDNQGWTLPITLASPRRFEGANATIRGTLDLRALRATITEMQTATGIARDQYTVALDATVTRDVRRGAASVTGVFDPRVEFKLDALEMYVTDPGADTFAPQEGGLLSVSRERSNRVTLLGRSLSVAALRAAASVLGLVVLALWLEWVIRAARGDEAALIERRYRQHLLPVRPVDAMTNDAIDVGSMAALARLAGQTGAPLLRSRPGTYLVLDGGRTYRYQVVQPAGAHVAV